LTVTSIVFLVVLAAALAAFAYTLTRRVQYVLLGRPEYRFDHIGRRLGGFVYFVFGQRKLFKEWVGTIHFFIFWGFIVIAFGTLQIIAEGFRPGFSFPWSKNFGFLLTKDLLSLLVLIGILVLVYLRYVVRKTRLEPSAEAGIILGLIFFLIVSELLYSGFTYAPEPTAAQRGAFIAVAVSRGVDGLSAAPIDVARSILWWVHVLLLLAFLVYIPLSKHLHLIMCPVNEFFRNLKPRGGQIETLDLENEDVEEFGVSKIQGFTSKQLLDLYACAECGRCQDHCPASQSGKALSPKTLMTKMRHHLDQLGPALRAGKAPDDAPSLIGEVMTEEEIWACTTCYSCQEQCPVQNEHVNKIIDMRRHLVMDRGDFPQEAMLAARNVEKNGNPWGVGQQTRADWAKDLGVTIAGQGELGEYLFWVGCAGAVDDRSIKVSKAIVQVLRHAGVTFSILGTAEKCCGDPMRRMGNEYLFQMLAQENVETLNSLGVSKIITNCPHCLNTLKNEYPAFAGNYEVIHYTELFERLLAEGRLQPLAGDAERVAYHDSCYLGRYQQQYEAPRKVLGALSGVTVLEAKRNRAKSFCCGAGGGRMWMEEEAGHRVNEVRVGQLLETSPQVIGVNCPYCLTMMEDGVKSLAADAGIKVMDVAEILAARLDGKRSAVINHGSEGDGDA
jgi:Fe-S oxidoreductase/nitrate reductase gamma subunit